VNDGKAKRAWSLYAFCFVQAFFVGFWWGETGKTKSKKTRTRLGAVRTETIHGLWNDQGMPVFTPGSNPRRLAAAAYHRGSCNFFHPPTPIRRVAVSFFLFARAKTKTLLRETGAPRTFV
jgi:hypothetical protein